MAVDSCHDPPGIIVAMYDSTNNKIFTQSFYEGSTIVSDPRLPVDLNVTVEQLPNAISVEVNTKHVYIHVYILYMCTCIHTCTV